MGAHEQQTQNRPLPKHTPPAKKKLPYGAPVVDVIRSSFPFPPTAALAKATAGLVLRISGHPL